MHSLRNLVTKINKNPQAISRPVYVHLYKIDSSRTDAAELAGAEFSRLAGKGETLSPKIVAQDLAKLGQLADQLFPFIDSVVAHHDRAPEGGRRWSEMHAAVVVMRRICRRYDLLLNLVDSGIDDSLPARNIDDELQQLMSKCSE